MQSVSHKHRRINISIPVETLRLLDEVAPPKKRSQFIAEAITQYVEKIKRVQLREQLKAGYLANAEMDRQIAKDWFPIDQEAYETYVEQDKGKSD